MTVRMKKADYYYLKIMNLIFCNCEIFTIKGGKKGGDIGSIPHEIGVYKLLNNFTNENLKSLTII